MSITMSDARVLGIIFLVQWTLVTSSHQKWIDTLPSFRTFNNEGDVYSLHEMTVDHNITGDVFVGARNVFHRLSADLEWKQTANTGPLKDSLGCLIPPYPCSKPRVQTDSDLLLVKLVYDFGDTPSLLMCGTLYNNLCQVRSIDNLQEYHWVHPYNHSLGYAANGQPYTLFHLFERGFDGRMSLFSLVHDEKERRVVPYLSSRVLTKEGDRYSFHYTFQNGTMSSTMTMKGKNSRYVMDNGIVHDDFIYFPILFESPGFFTNTIDSRLVRFCAKDPTFHSYAELPISCKYKAATMRFNAMYFGPSRKSSAKKALYTSFHNKWATGSALCIFEMDSIVEAFENSLRRCNEDVVGETCKSKTTWRHVDFCGSNGSPYIVAQALEVEHFIYLPFYKMDNLIVVKQNNDLVVVATATTDFTVLKISIGTGDLFYTKDLLPGKKTGYPFQPDKENKHIYIIKKFKVIKFPIASCNVYETCGDCFSRGKRDPLKCGWCAGQCAHLDECAEPSSFSTDTCTPTIYEVSPQKGPIQGANLIKVIGDGLGSYVDDTHNSISVAGIPCKVSSWNNTQVTCLLGSTLEEISGPVQLKVSNGFSSSLGYTVAGSTNSSSNFSYYVGPRVYGLYPGRGPTSGGTNVTLFGLDLDFDKDEKRSIVVRGRPCTLTRFDKNTASCITGKVSSTLFPKATAIIIDGIGYVMDKQPPESFNLTGLSQSFEYTLDPNISNIRPGITTLSGLMNLTATGVRLDTVLFPKLVVTIAETQIMGDSVFSENCWVDPKSKGTTMTCRTPTLKNRVIFPTPTSTHPLVARVSFLMDGVQALRDFPKHREHMSRLLYYPDPVFQEMGKIEKGQKVLEIKIYEGINLDLIHMTDKLQVKIAKDKSCKITSVLTDILFCDLPPSIFSNSSLSRTNLSVEVITGSTTHHLGYLQFDGESEDSNALWIFFAIAFILIALCVIFVSYKCFLRRRRKPEINVKEMTVSGNGAILNGYRIVPTENNGELTSSGLEHSAQSAVTETLFSAMPRVDEETMLLLQDKNLVISKSELKIGEKIGSGFFGWVFVGYLQRSNQTKGAKVAVKTLRDHSWSDAETVKTFLKEALIMRKFAHPNVLSLLGVCLDGGSGPFIVLEYMENKDLYTYIIHKTRVINVVGLLKFAIEVAAGMSYLEEKNCLHRDLAARNCVLDESPIAKVADFGLSRNIYSKNYYRNEKESKIPMKWTAPESIESRMYTTKSDVWSYGVLLWELMTRGSIPYEKPYVDNIDLVLYFKRGHRLPKPEKCPIPLYNIMLECWNFEPSVRPSFIEIHHYVSQIRDIIIENMKKKSQAAAQPLYYNDDVPAKHAVYSESQHLYQKMKGQTINNIFKEDS